MRVVAVAVVVAGIVASLSGGCSKDESGKHEAGSAGSQQELVQTEGGGAIVLTVDGRAVTEQEVAEEEGRLMQQFEGRVDPQQVNAMKEMVRKQAVDNIINRVLLDRAIEKEGITVTKAEMDAKMAEVRKQAGSEEELSRRLTTLGMTEDLLWGQMETALKVEKLLGRHRDVRDVTDSEVQAYYEENRDRFRQPERVKASHILIPFEPDDTDAEKSRKRDEAGRLLNELERGADFATLALRNSSCPSKEQGGDLGFFQKGQMVKPFEDAAFALEVGEISDVVETQYGYHIIKVTDRQEERSVPFEEAQESIAIFLEGQNKNEAMNSYLQEVRASAVIEYPDSRSVQ